MSLFRRRLMIANALKKSSGINYPGLIAAWSAKGKTNDDEDRAILKDLTGNGHDITLNGFAFSEMSGYGGYNTNFLSSNKWITGNSVNLKGEYTSSKAILSKGSAGFFSNNFRYISYDYLKFRFKTNANCDLNIYIKANNENDIKTIKVIKDEPTEIEFEDVNNLEGITQRWCYFNISTNNLPEEGLIIEQLPNYPDALVFDGVDDYGINENMLQNLNDFTVIFKRKPITTSDINSYSIVWYESNNTNDEFCTEIYITGSLFYRTTGVQNKLDANLQYDITTLLKNSYNFKTVNYGTSISGSKLLIGKEANMAFYSAYLFDHSLDEQEIKEFIRKYIDPEYLLPSERPQYITFADPEVERICVENWSSDGIGCTLEDVQKVTSLNNKFQGNTLITSFNELELFTSLTLLGSNEFKGCTSLVSINFPSSLNTIKDNAFNNCISLAVEINLHNLKKLEYTSFNNTKITKILNLGEITEIQSIYNNSSYSTFGRCQFLTEVILPNTVTSIGTYSFADCISLSKITLSNSLITINEGAFANTAIKIIELPETVTNIGWSIFNRCNLLKIVILRAIVPPTLDRILSEGFEKIYVPDDSVESYKTATNWSNYADRIHPISEYVPGEEDAE